MNRKMWIGALSAAMLLGGSVAAAGSVSGQGAPVTMDTPSSFPWLQMQDYITAEQAQKVALHVAAGQIHEIELEIEDGQIFYEIEIERSSGWVEVHVDALTGNVLAVLEKTPDVDDHDEDDADDIDDLDDLQKSNPAEIKVTPEHASDIAAKKVTGGSVVKVELDDDDDMPLSYEVELKLNRGEAEVNVDAASGKVLSVKQDHDDDDDDDHENDHDDDDDESDDDD